MALNQLFWSRFFEQEFVPQLRAIADALEKRTLPAFSGIGEEAEKVSEEVWEAFMSAPATGDEDPGDLADVAQQAGVSHYMLLDGIRQGMINLFAAALYHAFEQQVIFFLRKEVLELHEENDRKLFQVSELQNRLKALGIDITQFAAWSKVDELRLLANTVKHAEGESARKLHQLRKDLFEKPNVAGMNLSFGNTVPRVFQPLVGEDLYVSIADIRDYRDALIAFWRDLGEAMERA
jgi:hypothetical protein